MSSFSYKEQQKGIKGGLDPKMSDKHKGCHVIEALPKKHNDWSSDLELVPTMNIYHLLGLRVKAS